MMVRHIFFSFLSNKDIIFCLKREVEECRKLDCRLPYRSCPPPVPPPPAPFPLPPSRYIFSLTLSLRHSIWFVMSFIPSWCWSATR